MTDEMPTLGEALDESGYVPAYAPEECDEQCHNCGYDFDAEEWTTRHIHGGPGVGEDWKYTCPNCDEETVQVGI